MQIPMFVSIETEADSRFSFMVVFPHMSLTPEQNTIQQLLERVASGEHTVAEAMQAVAEMNSPAPLILTAESSPDEFEFDLDRQARCGFPEVIYAPGKSVDAVVRAFSILIDAGQNAFATRCEPEQIAAVLKRFPDAIHNDLARTVRHQTNQHTMARVPVITAGTSDRPVAEEACETLRWMEVEPDLIMDIGVAGPQRLLNQRHRFQGAPAVIVAAGMEGALPSVVGGWIDCPLFAVPTSVGYGTAMGGITALLGMLNSCASNVAVVNIDAGFKAGFLAGMVARKIAQAASSENAR